MPDSNFPRCGDHVHHAPTGEDWVVAWAEGAHLAPAGWPNSVALLSDCTLIKRATDTEHRAAVEDWRKSTRDDSRRARVLRLHGGDDA